MSLCARCGAPLRCAMTDPQDGPCWCTTLPPLVPLPAAAARCWCRACLESHIANYQHQQAQTPQPK